MELYAVLQRSAWRCRGDLQQAVDRSVETVREVTADDIRWLQCYVLKELDGTLGTVCVYAARSPEAIRKHAARIEMPVDEIVSIAETIVISPDATLPHSAQASRVPAGLHTTRICSAPAAAPRVHFTAKES
jgi:Protein of unknown function (DUF4242)